jgi:hypothetical protein
LKTAFYLNCIIKFNFKTLSKRKANKTGETIPGQLKKQTQKPTLKWVFMLMREITEVKIEVDSQVIIKIANLDEVKDKIIRLIGKDCEKYYL